MKNVRSFMLATVTCLLCSVTLAAQTVTVRVRVTYLKNGEPAKHQQVTLYAGDVSRASIPRLDGTTSSAGVALFHLRKPLPKTVSVGVENGRIRACASWAGSPLDEVLKRGVTIGVDKEFGSACKGDRGLNKRLAAKPGEIVIFVRKLTWWDNLKEY